MSTPSLRGQVQGDSLNLTMQLLHAGRRTCFVQVRTPLGEGQLHYLGGSLIHATYRHAQGEAALPGLLSIEQGTFVVYDETPTVPRTITRAHDAVLMTAAVALDEGRVQPAVKEDPAVLPVPAAVQGTLSLAPATDGQLDDLLSPDVLLLDGPDADMPLRPAVDQVPHLHLDLRGTTLSGEAWNTLKAVDGVRSIGEIAAATSLPLDTVRNLLAQHHLLGHVTYTPPLMPPAFWDDTRAATVRVVGPLGRLLLDDAAEALKVESGRVPRDRAQLFHDQLGQLVSPHKQAAFRAALAPVQARYGLQETR